MKLWKNKFLKVPELQVFRLKRLTSGRKCSEKRSKLDHVLVKFLYSGIRNLNKFSGKDVVPKWEDNQARFRFWSAFLDSIYSETTYMDIWKKGRQVNILILSQDIILHESNNDFQTYNGIENKQPYALSKEIAWEMRQPNES